MSVATKTGDDGKTSLYSGERVWKDCPRVEAFGTVDELSSFLGLAKHFLDQAESEILEKIQVSLVEVAAELATEPSSANFKTANVDPDWLESLIKKYEKNLILKGFSIPGGTKASANLDVCRTISRRLERRLVALNREKPVSKTLGCYLNRLSDLLYLLARSQEAKKI